MIFIIEDFFRLLKTEGGYSGLKKLMTYYCSAVTHGLKSAEVLTLSRPAQFDAWQNYGQVIAEELQLSCLELIQTRKRVTVLFYDHDRLQSILDRPDVRALLSRLGYTGENELQQLKQRYTLEKCPDEIGLFLGYPVEDVWGFIINNGQDYKASGYWKVYGEVQPCLVLFQAIKQAKLHTAQSLLSAE